MQAWNRISHVVLFDTASISAGIAWKLLAIYAINLPKQDFPVV